MPWLLFHVFTTLSYQNWCRIHPLDALCWWNVLVPPLSPDKLLFYCNRVLPCLCRISLANCSMIIEYLWLHSPMYACLVSTTNLIWNFISFPLCMYFLLNLPLCVLHIWNKCVIVHNSYCYSLAIVSGIHQSFFPKLMHNSSFRCSVLMECSCSLFITKQNAIWK